MAEALDEPDRTQAMGAIARIRKAYDRLSAAYQATKDTNIIPLA